MPLTINDATTEFVTLDEVKQHANITQTVSDTELTFIRNASQELVESLIGPVLHRSASDFVPWTSGVGVVLKTLPALSVTGVTDSTGAAVTGWTTDLPGGTVNNLRGRSLTIAYKVGRDSCPDAVRLATLIIAAHMWRTQLGNSPSAQNALPDSAAADVAPAFTAAFGLPSRAAELLKPYLKPTGVA
ncbi:MAG: phage gp6-like head-tail connector protein [Streptomycetaceae bacterium]|nr:phage gp6-like head-tail connector protein [Streptomycetaceae bacterium]